MTFTQNKILQTGSVPVCILLILSSALVQTYGLPLEPETDTAAPTLSKQPSPNHPQAKQGILEIPKHAATIIRNFIDRNLEAYLNLTTPVPNLQKPEELTNSIIGHYLLGNWYATPPPAPPYNPQQALNVVSSVITSNEPTYMEHSPHVTQPTAPPTEPAPPQSSETETKPPKPRTRRTTKTPVHILDTDPSLNGIYNSYGVLLNTPDEVYWIPEPDATRPSVIIPIESTTPPPLPPPKQTTETATVPSSTDAVEDSEENDTVLRSRVVENFVSVANSFL